MAANIMTGSNNGMWIIIGIIVMLAAGISLATLWFVRKRKL